MPSGSSPEGYAYILEEVAGRPRPQVRVWVSADARYRRMSLDVTLRDDAGRRDPERVAQALRVADRKIASLRAAEPEAPSTGPATVRETLGYALDPKTGKKHGPNSDQPEEWERASREVDAVIDRAMLLSAFRAQQIIGVVQSTLARIALGYLVHPMSPMEWAGAMALAAREHPRLPSYDAAVIVRAFALAKQALHTKHPESRTKPPEPVTTSWVWRTAHLVRAMIRHAAGRDGARFGAGDQWSLPKDLDNELDYLARVLNFRIERTEFRPTHSDEHMRPVLLHLRDPRYAMAAVLARVVNGDGALRARRSAVQLRGAHGAAVRKNTNTAAKPSWTWHDLPVAEALVVRSLLAREFAAVEAHYAQTGEDYRLIADTRWQDGAIRRIDGPAVIRHRRDVQLVDPRAHQLFDLGAEGRAGQIARCMRSDLQLDGTTGELLLRVTGAGTKLGRLIMLAPVQRALVAFNMECGYLAPFEANYRRPAGDPERLADYPLFPCGKLAYDRTTRRRRATSTTPTAANGATDAQACSSPADVAPASPPSLAEKTVREWHDDVEAVLGITHVKGRAMVGWRRAFANLYDGWHVVPRVKDLIMGHTTREKETHGSTRTDVYLNPGDTPLLREGQRLLEHARTVYALNGEAPSIAECVFPAVDLTSPT